MRVDVSAQCGVMEMVSNAGRCTGDHLLQAQISGGGGGFGLGGADA